MDCNAVLAVDEKTLCDMGIATKGDLLALKAFCEEKKDKEIITVQRERKKAELASLLKGSYYNSTNVGGSRSSKKRKVGEPKKVEQKRKRIEIGWLHRQSFEEKFTMIRSKDGGGTRTAEMFGSSGKMDIILYAKKLFFPSGKNPICEENDVVFSLGNFVQEEIGSTLVFPDNSLHPFTIENYQLSTKLSKIRLYLMTTCVTCDGDEEVYNICTYFVPEFRCASSTSNV